MIITCKQNAGRSGVERVADLTKVFKLMHTFQKPVTVSGVPVQNHPLKNRAPNPSKIHKKKID